MGVHIPIGYGLAAAQFQCVGVLDPMVVTFGYRCILGATGTASTIHDRATAVRTALVNGSGLLAGDNMANDYTFTQVAVTEEWGTGHIADVIGPPVAGSSGSMAPPPNCCHLVRKLTARGGRKGRGRMYWPPIWSSENFITAAGVQLATSVNSQQLKLNSLLNALNSASVPMVLLHENPADLPDTVTGLVNSALLATQRRRMR